MKIPHDPVALEEHFKDNDKGPLSNQGYMPYLNRFILDKVRKKMLKEYRRVLCFSFTTVTVFNISNCETVKKLLHKKFIDSNNKSENDKIL